MAGSIEIDIAGLEGNMAAEPRRFAHSANVITIASGTGKNDVAQDVLPAPAADEVAVLKRGACLYVGGAGDVDVEMESGNRVTFTGVAGGAFLPILVTKVYTGDGAGNPTTDATSILALF